MGSSGRVSPSTAVLALLLTRQHACQCKDVGQIHCGHCGANSAVKAAYVTGGGGGATNCTGATLRFLRREKARKLEIGRAALIVRRDRRLLRPLGLRVRNAAQLWLHRETPDSSRVAQCVQSVVNFNVSTRQLLPRQLDCLADDLQLGQCGGQARPRRVRAAVRGGDGHYVCVSSQLVAKSMHSITR